MQVLAADQDRDHCPASRVRSVRRVTMSLTGLTGDQPSDAHAASGLVVVEAGHPAS